MLAALFFASTVAAAPEAPKLAGELDAKCPLSEPETAQG